MAQVRYTGPRLMAMTYDIYVNGTRYNGQGYRFGRRRQTAVMSQEEADVLTGATAPLYAGDAPINAAIVRGTLTEEEASSESWEVVGG